MLDLKTKSRKWLITINNPQNLGEEYSFDKLKEYISKKVNPTYFCYSFESGNVTNTYHVHIFIYAEYGRTAKRLKKLFPTAHFDVCRGTIKQIRNYVFKVELPSDSKEKEDTRIEGMQFESGEAPFEKQGKRSDLDEIEELIKKGYTPNQIYEIKFSYRRYEKMIRDAFYAQRLKSTPLKRNVNVVVHIGEAGSGKSHVMTELDEDELYIMTDYDGGGFDNYFGQKILFLDEFRGQVK